MTEQRRPGQHPVESEERDIDSRAEIEEFATAWLGRWRTASRPSSSCGGPVGRPT